MKLYQTKELATNIPNEHTPKITTSNKAKARKIH